MKQASLVIDPDFTVGDIDHRLFGALAEHMGRCIYTGIFEPGHPTADEHGFRADVVDLVRELGTTLVRYPGGNFVSGYRWEDGVGPVNNRPARLDMAWQSREPNTFGLNEFHRWTELTRQQPMMAVNLGTRGVHEAADLVEYCNHPGGSALSDLRKAHGRPTPFGIKLWCLGNEMDGPWQIGHKTAYEYGRLAREAATAMKSIDPSIEVVACGSSNGNMPTFGDWEATVLSECYDETDYLSLHAYYGQGTQDLGSFLASAAHMDAFIDGVIATADHVRAKLRRRKRIQLSFDEWNVWYTDTFKGGDWAKAPRLSEDNFNVADAVVVGNMFMSLLRHADRVAVACLAQLVNVLGPIRTQPDGPAWKQTIFHPFALTAANARGQVLRNTLRSPRYETTEYGDVDLVDTVVTYDAESGQLVVFAVNRDTSEPVALHLAHRDLKCIGPGSHTVLADKDHQAMNTQADSHRVEVRTSATDPHDPRGELDVLLEPLSWSMLRLPVQRPS
ncbi:arabinosylfuranosidase ArfA [Segeticoccus rhizosphaerae]|uniref:arabinosylfuranosidase ArfA n=1 Tax=Segeticoccus rhizosphaerae TaxID=1104777 RepID=UPI00192E4586|nr:alpha-N-arabinofuranosidase [Ornithinicoccus soli]